MNLHVKPGNRWADGGVMFSSQYVFGHCFRHIIVHFFSAPLDNNRYNLI